MNEQHFQLSTLDIIGYADCLNQVFLPQIVPPIFCMRNKSNRILMPPFRIVGDEVLSSQVGVQSDLERAVLGGQATRLDTRISAQPDYRLWVDETLQPRYEPATTVAARLRQVAREKSTEALRALARNRVEEAMQLAQTAISADDGCLNAILVKALVNQIEGNQACVELLTEMADTIAPGSNLGAWIQFFAELATVQIKPETFSSASSPHITHNMSSPEEQEGPAGYDWPGAGGGIATEKQYSDKEIAQAVIAQYRPLFEMPF